ncbi:hypothetical protein FDP41_007406 [Naegleria fowleri]|uniref:RNA-dependent RNA polymerase n=1 Tax=Naegleria fowleri TaxID=5763 RepID=A0A6A5CG13_NAEFO|nr:uncharacterized protein FDP41_007406 [Naegleria fowleri]KAF0984229.1 hypothetical protein FDP41_007406 [Naegleria fowleri]
MLETLVETQSNSYAENPPNLKKSRTTLLIIIRSTLDELREGARDREYLLKRIFVDDDSEYSYETKIVRAVLENREPIETNLFIAPKIKQKIIVERMFGLLNKSLQGQIKYPHLLNLKGVIDQSEFLKDNQVLIASFRFKATTSVVVFRNPVAHANDFLRLHVVSPPADKEFLNSVRECIVFPKLAGKKGPHQFLSSGDLDGDLYSILTDPCLVMLLDKPFSRMDYEQLAKDYKMKRQRPTPVDDVEESRKDQTRFFVDYKPTIGVFYTILTNDLYLDKMSEDERKKYAFYFTLSIDAVKHGSVILQDPKPCKSIQNDFGLNEEKFAKINQFEKKLIEIVYDSILSIKEAFVIPYQVNDLYRVKEIGDSTKMKEAFNNWEKNNKISRSERKDLLSQVYGKKQHKQWLLSKVARVINSLGNSDTTKSIAERIHSNYFLEASIEANVEKAKQWLNQAYAYSDQKLREKMVRFVYLVCYKWLSICHIQNGDVLSFGVCKYKPVNINQ